MPRRASKTRQNCCCRADCDKRCEQMTLGSCRMMRAVDEPIDLENTRESLRSALSPARPNTLSAAMLLCPGMIWTRVALHLHSLQHDLQSLEFDCSRLVCTCALPVHLSNCSAPLTIRSTTHLMGKPSRRYSAAHYSAKRAWGVAERPLARQHAPKRRKFDGL